MHQIPLVSQVLPLPAQQSVAPAVAAPGALQAGEVSDYVQQAKDLLDLTATRRTDGAISHIRPIVPSSHKSFNGQVGQGRIAILAMCIRHVAETGDGGLSMFLGDCLQHLPQAAAELEYIIELQISVDNGYLTEDCARGRLLDLLESGNVSGELDRARRSLAVHVSSFGLEANDMTGQQSAAPAVPGAPL